MKSEAMFSSWQRGITSRSSSLWNRFMLLCRENKGAIRRLPQRMGFLELPGVHGARSQVARIFARLHQLMQGPHGLFFCA